MMVPYYFDVPNPKLALNFGMANPNSSTYLGTAQCKIVKQWKNGAFHRNFHIATITVNMFEG